ncbi:MAG: hypothetical protein Q4G36_09385 [Paracoccus sp. (in: a-proteobacteria)]|nr:hypothetical protein [Paracoccus sp. (in: a-proteobacteria)]
MAVSGWWDQQRDCARRLAMTSAALDGDKINVSLSRQEALVLFEWLSRNWEKTNWENDELFEDPAEKQLLIWLENDLGSLLAEPFHQDYRAIVSSAYRALVPEKESWE